MELIKKISAARIIQISMNILWIVSLVIAGGMVGFFIFICFLPEYDPGGWTIMIDPDSVHYSISSKVSDMSKIRFEASEIELGFTTPTRFGIILFQFSRVVAGMFILLQILYSTRKIASSWTDKSPFSMDNIRRLKKIAIYLMIIPLFASLDLICTHYFLSSRFEFPVDPGFFINWNMGMVGNILSRFHWEFLLFGVGIWALSEVFKKGLDYQEDSKSFL
ncbi:MAG: DUF2975 domain-containing protein [Bacteroidetes bacterium]|jgi:hypothetical protein|nr:DUF2975 domain-containing protein [Bacteroidota bacterium]